MPRIDVFYGRTDNTRGYKEYTCVIVETSETGPLQYYDDLYEPQPGCHYKVLYEVPMSNLSNLYKKAGVDRVGGVGWIQSPLKEVVLDFWKENK
mmetsp:Transcript_9113/g.20594  ORF Transcript_9113/g.20594 Transcript_9113/m.20594 type:complete len:94 (-) Transcript_9113:481-762(-)